MAAEQSLVSAVIAANRFGLGARPGELNAIGSDARGWLLAQVKKSQSVSPDIAALASSERVLRQFEEQREQRRENRSTANSLNNSVNSDSKPAKPAVQAGAALRQTIAPHYFAQAAARIRTAVTTTAPFHERLVQFWTNHFAVSVDKIICLGIAGTLENEAVRPNANGHFADLLLAVEQHPAMIAYLDNQFSVGPNSKLATLLKRRPRQAERKADINENLAREILELHTLGVHGGYTQTDVTTFAKVLTGWSIGGGRGPLANGPPGRFFFRENLHEPGAQTLLGKRYREDGIDQPRAVLRDLARHPSTATFLATKLVRHFIADDPPQDCVERVSRAYRDSEGYLPKVYAALIDCDAAWNPTPAKYKTPQDFVYSTFRGMDIALKEPRALIAPFELLGQRPYSPGSPAGWPDTARDWDGADALMKRIEWTLALADRTGNAYPPLQLAENTLGPLLREQTSESIRRAASGAQGLGLLLMSPEFQRR